MILVRNLRLEPGEPAEKLKRLAAKKLRVPERDIVELKLVKRSLDARKKNDIHYVCALFYHSQGFFSPTGGRNSATFPKRVRCYVYDSHNKSRKQSFRISIRASIMAKQRKLYTHSRPLIADAKLSLSNSQSRTISLRFP